MAPKSLHFQRKSKGPVVLMIWDGFGISPHLDGNAVREAKMPNWQRLLKQYPNTLLDADGEAVGLPPGQPGNSEAGHSTIGAGRAVESDHVRIDRSIKDGSFQDNPALLKAAAHCIRNKKTLHLMGLLTNHRSGHASPDHVKALVDFASGLNLPYVALHLFTDGRDTAPFHAAHLIAEMEKKLPPNVVIASVMGRYYAMDRNRFWKRTDLAYHALTLGEGVIAESATQAVADAYARGESDEFITPTVVCRNQTCIAPILDEDVIVYWNLRSDRARQLTKPFVMKDFEEHESHAFQRRAVRKNLCFVTLTEFGQDLDHVIPAFPHREVSGTLVEALRYHGQIYLSESEKFSQITYFLNGGYDRARYNEERIRVPSPRVSTYDQVPTMRASEVTDRLLQALHGSYDCIVANLANADMVAHTGNEEATVKACEALDASLKRVWEGVQAKHGTLIVTSDHGNAEQLRSSHGGVDTEHNPNPVPLLIAGSATKGKHLRRGTLADIAPTMLHLLGVEKPLEMRGHHLLF